MPAITRTDKRRRIAENQDDVIEISAPKRHTTSSERGELIQWGKIRRKRNEVVDVESYAVPRTLIRRDDLVPEDGFPWFPHGTVYIQLTEMHHKYTYIFEKTVLERASIVLANILGNRIIEVDSNMAEDMKKIARLEYFFILKYFEHIDNWGIDNVSFTISQPPERAQSQLSKLVQSASTPTRSKVSGLRAPPTPQSLQPLGSIEPLTSAATLPIASVYSGPSVKDADLIHISPHSIPVFTGSENSTPNSKRSTTMTPPEAASAAPAPIESKGMELEVKLEEGQVKVEIAECKVESNVEANDSTTESFECKPESKTEANDSSMEAFESTPGLMVEENGTIKEITESAIKEGLGDNFAEIVRRREPTVSMDIKKGKSNTRESTSTHTDTTMVNAEKSFTPHTDVENCRGTTQKSSSTTTGSAVATTEFIVDPTPIVKPSMELEDGTSITQEGSSTDTNNTKMRTQRRHVRYAHGEALNQLMIPESITSAPKHVVNSDEGRSEAVEAHHNLFCLLHNTMPEFDTHDINNALEQIERIAATAKRYRCLPLVRHHLSYHLVSFGRGLFAAILQDPPRWLLLSLSLNCGPLFKEAIVHIVGYYPRYPWINTPPSKLPQKILNIIRKKVDNLNVLKASVDTDLFTSSIAINNQNLTFATLANSDFENWFIAQLWRDWFCDSLLKDATKHEVASTYRLIAKGGNAYLDRLTVYDCLIRYKGKVLGSWDLNIVNEDLKIMKDYAQKIVKDLVVNNSMLNVEEAGINHLTCTKVENDELPWIEKDGA